MNILTHPFSTNETIYEPSAQNKADEQFINHLDNLESSMLNFSLEKIGKAHAIFDPIFVSLEKRFQHHIGQREEHSWHSSKISDRYCSYSDCIDSSFSFFNLKTLVEINKTINSLMFKQQNLFFYNKNRYAESKQRLPLVTIPSLPRQYLYCKNHSIICAFFSSLYKRSWLVKIKKHLQRWLKIEGYHLKILIINGEIQ